MSYTAPEPVAHLDRSQTTVLFYGCPFKVTGCTFPRVAAVHNNAKSIVRDHINAYMNGRPYKCSECNSNYEREADLKRHLTKAHSQLKKQCVLLSK
ncbi:hypothetical protein CPB85DRAFT_1309900 [Mucidula mucida]|nr:hypothetical protein CPB85DRAFT_1309900 [Mucidula mucida]